MDELRIGCHRIADGEPCFLIAEIGVNHNGDEEMAKRLVDAAKHAGADAVKFQTFSADRLSEKMAPTAAYQQDNTGETNQHALLAPLELDEGAHRRLLEYCANIDVMFLSSPFDLESIDLLDSLGVPAFKVPSPDCVSARYLEHMGSKGRPVILSTGMCDLGEVVFGVDTLREAGSGPVGILHCTSCYPAPLAELNLRAMHTIAAATGAAVGYSDHSEGVAVAIAAVSIGARIIEKHITLDRGLPGPDHRASIEPKEFAQMVSGIRAVEVALGSREKRPQPSEASARLLGRRSLAAAKDLCAGQKIGAGDMILLRPATGIAPRLEAAVVGRTLCKDLPACSILNWADFA